MHSIKADHFADFMRSCCRNRSPSVRLGEASIYSLLNDHGANEFPFAGREITQWSVCLRKEISYIRSRLLVVLNDTLVSWPRIIGAAVVETGSVKVFGWAKHQFIRS